MARERVATGIEGLDEMLKGGLPQGKSYLISGEPGTGKTTFSAQYILQGIRNGENGVFISIDEKPTHVVEDAESLGWDLRTPVEEGKLTLLDVSPYFNWVRYGKTNTIDTNEVIQDLSKQIRRINAKRLVFDSVVPLVLHRERVHDVQEFIRNLVFSIDDNLGCTTLMTSHVWPGQLGLAGVGIEEYLVSGIIGLRLEKTGNKFERKIFVRKMRGTPIDLSEHTFEIMHDRGIVIRPYV
ncbi:MAG: AAA family ATPase [Abitibacteriaceae bacterium]|nr:AAA family ATPase [Abditibacteriaceae bacterium]